MVSTQPDYQQNKSRLNYPITEVYIVISSITDATLVSSIGLMTEDRISGPHSTLSKLISIIILTTAVEIAYLHIPSVAFAIPSIAWYRSVTYSVSFLNQNWDEIIGYSENLLYSPDVKKP